MRFNFKKLALLGAWIIFTEGSAYPQDVIDKRQPLVEMSVRRLAIAEQAALAKGLLRTRLNWTEIGVKLLQVAQTCRVDCRSLSDCLPTTD